MAFLCPSRRGRQKKKHKEPKPPFLGRITGSSSVETLLRVGLEKQHGLSPDARMCVTQDFLATAPGELCAQHGDNVYRLYSEGSWVYVITERGQEGFVPTICLTPVDRPPSSLPESNKDGVEKTSGNENESNTGKGTPGRHSPPHRYNIREAEIEKGFNTSMHADEGSDLSSTHSSTSLRRQINPLPKPARKQSIPDVVSTASGSVKADKLSTTVENTVAHSNVVNSHRKELSHQDRSNDKLGGRIIYNDRITQHSSSNVLELPDRQAGARDSHTSAGDSIVEVKTFVKKDSGKTVMAFQFEAREENDLKVQKGEVVTVLNDRDPDWVWVRTKNGNEGFVPKSFTCPIPHDLVKTDDGSERKIPAVNPTLKHSRTTKSQALNNHDVRELRTIRNFDAQSTDDISVLSGERVFADLANQIEEDWLWVYAPATQSYGYIPKDNVRWPSNPMIETRSALVGVDGSVSKPV